MVEIVKAEDGDKSKLKVIIGKTKFDEEVEIKFINDKNTSPATFKWSDLKKGYVLAILYAEAKDGAVEVGNLDNCYVFKASLTNVTNEGFATLEDADYVHRKWTLLCRNCD